MGWKLELLCNVLALLRCHKAMALGFLNCADPMDLVPTYYLERFSGVFQCSLSHQGCIKRRACNYIDIKILDVTKHRFQIAFPVE